MPTFKRFRVVRIFKIKTNLTINPPLLNGKIGRIFKKLLSYRVGLNHYNVMNDGPTIQEKYISIVIFRYQIQLIYK
jgi:hypothetical protein